MISFCETHLIGRKWLALLLIVALPGCTNIKNDRNRTRTEGALAGSAMGAAAGAGIGALVGGKNKGRAALAGAAAGALAGGLAGAAYGDSVAKKKEGYARTEDALDRSLQQTRSEIAERKTYNAGLRTEIGRQRERLAMLRASSNSAGRAVEEFELRSIVVSRAGELDRRARSWQETIDAHKAALRAAGNDPRAAELRKGVDELSQQQAELRRQRNDLMSIARDAR